MTPGARAGLRLVRGGAPKGAGSPPPAEVPKPEELAPLVRWAIRIALVLAKLMGMAYRSDDLVGYALDALTDALRRYNPARRVPFKAFARHRIVGEVLDAIKAERERGSFEIAMEDADELAYGADEDPDALFQTTGVEGFVLCCAADALHADPEACLLRHDRHAELHRAVEQLPRPAQQLVALRYWKGLPWDEIVGQLGLPLSTLRDHDRALRKALRGALLGRDEVFPWPYETT